MLPIEEASLRKLIDFCYNVVQLAEIAKIGLESISRKTSLLGL